jgi:mono/diheme cytochrome c family protein
VMDFDHIGVKTGNVSSFIYSWSTRKVLEEVAQCEVVCANCHRVRTHLRMKQGGKLPRSSWLIPEDQELSSLQ